MRKLIITSLLFFILSLSNIKAQQKIIDPYSVTKIVVELTDLGSENTYNILRTEFYTTWDSTMLTYDKPEEIKHFCRIMNSAKPCTRPFSSRFPSPEDIRLGKNYILLKSGGRFYYDPINATFKIIIYAGNNRSIIWGGNKYFDTEYNRYETPRALLCEFGKVEPDLDDWRMLWECR